jgi:hypothetical protein
MTTLKEVLQQRGKRYGDYEQMAEVQQRLKGVMRSYPSFHLLNPGKQEALDMFATKIGRILTGDPDYDDNWKDIAGYATKVLEYLDSE